ncbi:MAG: hypothetical protein L6Q76_28505, partial [Polyangiaceae bacterium]|nr:hypothetical protein [Polyangiaceae bacterium]
AVFGRLEKKLGRRLDGLARPGEGQNIAFLEHLVPRGDDHAVLSARDYRRLLEALAEARIDFERAAKLDRLNADLDALLDALPDAAASGG